MKTKFGLVLLKHINFGCKHNFVDEVKAKNRMQDTQQKNKSSSDAFNMCSC